MAPGRPRSLLNEQIIQVKEDYRAGVNCKIIAKTLGVSERTIQRCLIKSKVRELRNYTRVDQDKKNQIEEANKKGMTESKTAKDLKVSQATVSIYWKNGGLEPYRKHIKPEQEDKIKEAYAKDVPVKKAAKDVGVSESTVRKRYSELNILYQDPEAFNNYTVSKFGTDIKELLKDYKNTEPVPNYAIRKLNTPETRYLKERITADLKIRIEDAYDKAVIQA